MDFCNIVFNSRNVNTTRLDYPLLFAGKTVSLSLWRGTGGGSPGEHGAGGVRKKKDKKGREAGSQRGQEAGEKLKKESVSCFFFFYCLWSTQKHEATNIFRLPFNSSETSNKTLCAKKRKFALGLISLKLETIRGRLRHRWWVKCHDTYTRVSAFASLRGIASLSMQRFWATDGNRKCAVFLFNLSSHHHIYIVLHLHSQEMYVAFSLCTFRT